MYLLICSIAGNTVQLVPAVNQYFHFQILYLNTKKILVVHLNC
jgi:hypothetical protein